MTAYVVLRDHPLGEDSAGPNLSVDAPTLAAYQTGTAAQDAEVKVAQGETLSELAALEGLLVDSGNDMATLLADWDAGSTTAFVTKMNGVASSLGMRSTHITDPSGLDSSTVSSPADLVRLGEAAMAIGSFRQIVDLGQATLPVDGLEYNLNFDLGQDGIVGIKTGSDAAANGCYLFASVQSVAGRNVTVVGAVLDSQARARTRPPWMPVTSCWEPHSPPSDRSRSYRWGTSSARWLSPGAVSARRRDGFAAGHRLGGAGHSLSGWRCLPARSAESRRRGRSPRGRAERTKGSRRAAHDRPAVRPVRVLAPDPLRNPHRLLGRRFTITPTRRACASSSCRRAARAPPAWPRACASAARS